MAEQVPSDLRNLVESSLPPGVRLEGSGRSSDHLAWWFNLMWRGQHFELSVRHSWWEDQRKDLIALLAWLAAPAPEATLSGQRFWLRLKASETNDSVRYQFAVFRKLQDQETAAIVKISGTARALLSNAAGLAGRIAPEYEISMAIVALKDRFDSLTQGDEISVHSSNLEFLTKRARTADQTVREYVSSKLYQAYQGSTGDVALAFGKHDLDYLGISEDDFRRATSLVEGEDWHLQDLTIQPRRAFLKRFDSTLGGGSSVVNGGAGSASVFICHAEVDKQVANALRDYLRTADKKVDIFVASHPESLPGGHEWWDDIRDNLKRAKIVLTLVSSRSKDRPWLYFESGGGFFKGALVIPLALPPERKSFPLPLGVLQGFDLGSTTDVKALVKQLSTALSVAFARSSEDLAREIDDRMRKMSVDVPQASTVQRQQPSWEVELRKLAARGGTVRVHPVVPAVFAAKEFAIQEIEATGVGLRKLDSSHVIYVPPYRVLGIRRDASGYVLDVLGRVQWVDEDSNWHFMPEELQVNDPHGLPREIPTNTDEVTHLIGKLRSDGWHVAFVHEPNAKARAGKDYQLVYGSDGRYLKIPGRPYAQLMVKYRAGAGP